VLHRLQANASLVSGLTFGGREGIQIAVSGSDLFVVNNYANPGTVGEPSKSALLGVGAIGLIARGWRRRRQPASGGYL